MGTHPRSPGATRDAASATGGSFKSWGRCRHVVTAPIFLLTTGKEVQATKRLTLRRSSSRGPQSLHPRRRVAVAIQASCRCRGPGSPRRLRRLAMTVRHQLRQLVLVPHRNADPPLTKPVALSAGCRRRGWRFLWCERARVLVEPGVPEAPPIAPWAASPGSALFRL